MLNESAKESAFLVTNASGRHINLLNDSQPMIMAAPSPPSSEISDENVYSTDSSSGANLSSSVGPSATVAVSAESSNAKRKYHCTEPGCTKSFTTSGHLARHNRIHTGEKNFPCLFPGCLSRFSRQDNMMQHYRTHMSPKSRRTQKKVIAEDLHPRPRLHAHQRIRSDPYRVERPLTIDQHLNNYRRSLLSHPSTVDRVASSVKYNMPTPLGAVAASHMQKQQLQHNDYISHVPVSSTRNANGTWSVAPVGHEATTPPLQATPAPAPSHKRKEMNEPVTPDSELPTHSPETMFYQHRPLTFTREPKKRKLFPFTLLHPTGLPGEASFDSITKEDKESMDTPPLSSSSTSSFLSSTEGNNNKNNTNNSNSNNGKSSSQAGLLQLAHIVSTFG